MQFHYPLDPKKIPAEGSIHKETTYQGSDRKDFYRHVKKKKEKKKTNKLNEDLDWVFAHRQPSKKCCLQDRRRKDESFYFLLFLRCFTVGFAFKSRKKEK